MNTTTLCRITLLSGEAEDWLDDNKEELKLERWQFKDDCLAVNYEQSDKIRLLMLKEGLIEDEDFEIN